MTDAPLAIDLFCGLGGWTDGLLAEGYRVIGFDNERHVYGDARYPAQLVLQDVLTIHGSQFKDAALIVASPPCQEFSYMAMPWTIAKQKAREYRPRPSSFWQQEQCPQGRLSPHCEDPVRTSSLDCTRMEAVGGERLVPHLDTGQLLIPWGGISPRSRRASEQGARVAVRFAASQASRMLRQYLDVPLTDLKMSALIGIPESRVSARRSGLMARGLVAHVEDVIGPFGAASGKYGLTAKGRAVADSLKER